MRILRMLICLFWVIILLAFGGTFLNAHTRPDTKGVVLLVGDGMGLNIVRATEIYCQGINRGPLALSTIQIRGTTNTGSANSEVTDSAAAITALLSGHKTDNGRLNILPDNQRVYTIPQAAREKGLAIGVVSTTRLTHATPAAMYGCAVSRSQEQLLADQFLDLKPEVALAGGLQYFVPSTVSKKSKRTDQRDVVAEAKQLGYAFVANAKELRSLETANLHKLLGLFSDSHMAYEIDRVNDSSLKDQPSLADMTRVALEVVAKNPKGFFVMIEGGRIDHACHAHDLMAAIYDVIAFDDAVKVALDFQKDHPDVLIIVTADHETGGLGLGRGTEYALDIPSLKSVKASIELLDKKIAHNPREEAGKLLNSSCFELSEQEKQILAKQPQDKSSACSDLLGSHGTVNRYVGSWFGHALSEIMSSRAKVGWTTFVHTADPVITYAIGPGERYFLGTYNNTDIAANVFKILGLQQKEGHQ